MKTLEELLSEWEVDCKLDREQMDVSSLESSILHAKYLKIYAQVSKELRKAKQDASALRHIKNQYYNGTMSKEKIDEYGWPYDPYAGAIKPIKSEIAKFVDNDSEMKEANKEVEDWELYKDAVSQIMEHIKWRGQNIKNAIDWVKFQAGF